VEHLSQTYGVQQSVTKFIGGRRAFCPVNSLVVARNMWLKFLGKIGLFSNLAKRLATKFLKF
jgi:hypothetical protein